MTESPLAETDGAAAGAPAQDRAFLGHPRGLGVLAFTEAWLSFSLYGMLALLVLYMTRELLKPGHLEHVLGFPAFRALMRSLYHVDGGQPLASAVTGLYSALAYALPIFGGLIADRLTGRTRAIVAGCLLMTAGHFLLSFEPTFVLALVCLLLGVALAGNLKAQVGGLYGPRDLRRADAFQVYSISVSVAVIVAPLVCSTLGEDFDYSWGFAAAGVGMLLGAAGYLAGRRWLPPDPKVTRAAAAERAPLTGRELKVVLVLVALLPVFAVGALGNMEIFNGYLVWGKANYQLVFFGRPLAVGYLISLDAFISLFTLAGSMAFWRWWSRRRREPDEIVKAAIGTVIMAFAPLVLALASWSAAAGAHKVGLGWGLAFHLVNDIGFSNVYPVGMALYSRAAPPRLGATVVNAYSLHIALANLMVGALAGLLARMDGTTFWLLHAGLIGAAAVVMLASARLFHRTLAPQA